MSTIRDRARAHWDESNYVDDIIDVVCKFGLAERALQRQECADKGVAMYCHIIGVKEDRSGNARKLREAILTAGTEKPHEQGPFGCGCGWVVWGERTPTVWRLKTSSNFGIYSDDCDYCPKCGKPRREK